MAKSIYQSEIILNMNSRLFINALHGVTEEQGISRISDHSNPLNWLAAHTIWARYNICKLLGKPVDKDPYEGMFDNFKPFDPTITYPTLESSRDEWKKATVLLQHALDTVSEEHLAADCPFKSPIGDHSFGGSIAFLAQHESYDLGQIGYLKKYFTGEAMKY